MVATKDCTAQRSEQALIEASLGTPLSAGWNKIPGIEVDGERVTVDPDQYFYRYESPSWIICDWDRVRSELVEREETEHASFEQQTLDYVRANGVETDDGGRVMETAEEMYTYLFREEHLDDLSTDDVTEFHLQILREMGTVMSLNRVALTGRIANVGPAWFFPLCSEKVFGLDSHEAELVDELYHGAFFNEYRRVESVKAHAALGGRLVHGCQSVPNQSGGCVVSYGTDIRAFYQELQGLRTEWMNLIREL